MRRLLLRWRTYRGRRTAVRFLEPLAIAVRARGWRCVRLYEPEQFPMPVPLLWIYASGAGDDVGIVVGVRAVPGGWAYHQAQWGRLGHLCPCGDAEQAAERVDRLLRPFLFSPAR